MSVEFPKKILCPRAGRCATQLKACDTSSTTTVAPPHSKTPAVDPPRGMQSRSSTVSHVDARFNCLQTQRCIRRAHPVRAQFPLEARPVPLLVSVERAAGSRENQHHEREPLRSVLRTSRGRTNTQYSQVMITSSLSLLSAFLFQIMHMQPFDLRRRLFISFKGEEGLDYGGVARYNRLRRLMLLQCDIYT